MKMMHGNGAVIYSVSWRHHTEETSEGT